MADHVYAQVPPQLAQLLDEEGFPEVEVVRGPDQWAQVITVALSAGEHLLTDLSSLVTVYVARDQLRGFARRLAFWARGSTAPQYGLPPEGRAAVTLTRDANRVTVEFTSGPDGRPAVDAETLVQAIGSLLAAAPAPSRPEPAATDDASDSRR